MRLDIVLRASRKGMPVWVACGCPRGGDVDVTSWCMNCSSMRSILCRFAPDPAHNEYGHVRCEFTHPEQKTLA